MSVRKNQSSFERTSLLTFGLTFKIEYSLVLPLFEKDIKVIR